MAYPSVDAPYGLLPINLIGGQVFAGSTRQIPINSGSATAIFFGDVVKLGSDGTLSKDTGTDAATPVGVFMGCSYTDSVYGKTFRQYYPGAVTASDINAFVVDDPDTLFKVAVVSSGTTVGYVNRTAVGNNAVLVQNAGNTATGNSKVAIDDTTGTTATFPVRIIDVVPETHTAGNPGSYTEVVVKWNAGLHQYNNATGV
ncbi:MAG: hypothetical protein JSW30_06010 [Dehalococcoidia bacterium]|jgi:hypothetical protein|nr:MAG: hypothetical protein JSW30_06010 [Dehalococcoidia bacterium]